MPRISKETIQRVKAEVSLSNIFDWLDVHTVGTNKAFCPLCTDKDSRRPGMSYDDARGLWHCFVHDGGGDSIEFVKQYFGVSFTEAVERIAGRFGIPVTYDDDGLTQEERSHNEGVMSALDDAQELFIRQRTITKFKQFRQERSLTDEAIDRFGIGYSDSIRAGETIRTLLKNHTRQELLDAGLVAEARGYGSGQDGLYLRYEDRVTFPIRNAAGTIVGFGGRDTTGNAKAKYLNTAESGMFRKRELLYGMDTARRAISKTGSVIICEGYMDVIALQTHGFENAVGAMGTAVTAENLRRLARTVDRIVLSLDADEAGQRAAARTASHVPAGYKPTISVLTIPRDRAKDPDEFFNMANGTTDEFAGFITDATPLYLFCAKSATADEMRRIANIMNDADGDPSTNNETDATNRLFELRRTAYRKVTDVVMQNAGRIHNDELRLMASWFVQATGVMSTTDRVATAWLSTTTKARSGNKTNGVRNASDAAVRQPTQMQSVATAEGIDKANATGKIPHAERPISAITKSQGDRLLWMAYANRDDTSEALTAALDSDCADAIDGIMGSDARQALLYKIVGMQSEQGLWDLLTPTERDALSAAVSTHGNMHKDVINRRDIDECIWQLMAGTLRERIRREQNAPQPDFERLIADRQLLQRAEARAKGKVTPTIASETQMNADDSITVRDEPPQHENPS